MKRYDGRRLKSVSPFDQLYPYLLTRRSEAQVFSKQVIYTDTIDAYIRQKRLENIKLSYLHVNISVFQCGNCKIHIIHAPALRSHNMYCHIPESPQELLHNCRRSPRPLPENVPDQHIRDVRRQLLHRSQGSSRSGLQPGRHVCRCNHIRHCSSVYCGRRSRHKGGYCKARQRRTLPWLQAVPLSCLSVRQVNFTCRTGIFICKKYIMFM